MLNIHLSLKTHRMVSVLNSERKWFLYFENALDVPSRPVLFELYYGLHQFSYFVFLLTDRSLL